MALWNDREIDLAATAKTFAEVLNDSVVN